MRTLLLIFFSFWWLGLNAQPPGKRPAWMVGVGYAPLVPLADMAERFDLTSSLGISFGHKSKNNIYISGEVDYLFGAAVKENVLVNITDRNGQLPVYTGGFYPPELLLRGLTAFVTVGKVIALNENNSGSGLRLDLGVGYMQHRIAMPGTLESVPQVSGDYADGYDRFTSGFALREAVSYHFLNKRGTVCFSIGLEFTQGFTRGQRNFQFDIREGYDRPRSDFLLGPRITWYLPIFHYSGDKGEYFFR